MSENLEKAKSTSVKHTCGCVNEVDEASGVTKCIKKCEDHITWSLTHPSGSLQNYVDMGCLRNGIPQNSVHINEFIDGFGELEPGNGRKILEVGCGIGLYVPMFLAKGWQYRGVEASAFAAHWVESVYNVPCDLQPFEQSSYTGFDLVVAAHVLEHLPDVTATLKRMYNAVAVGGKLYVLVPDDTDQTNPDHVWFFTEQSLKRVILQAGFSKVVTTMRRHVSHENFIYAVCERGQ